MKNKKILKIILVGMSIILLISIIFALIFKLQKIKYAEILNCRINQIVDEIRKEYPKIEDETIIKILNSENKLDKDFLKQYDFNEKISSIKSLENQMNKSLYINILLIILLGIFFTMIVLIYILRQEKKIKHINDYIKEVNKGNYSLDIEDNEEGELPKLRNELYKTTVLLKEVAQNSKQESINLSNSLADISHQIKTPLTSIRIMLDNIEDNPDMNTKTREDFIKEISKQVEWISSLVISLLKISKFDAGVIKMHNTKINVKKFIEEIIENLAILIEIKELEIILNVNDKSSFEVDYKWQQEAITNIIKNAIEYSNQGGKIYINVEDNSLFLKIKIKDEGKGIDKKDLRHIFERFYKVDGSSDTSIGIGLSLAKTIIEQNNGYIKVDSKKGYGTLFEIKYIKKV